MTSKNRSKRQREPAGGKPKSEKSAPDQIVSRLALKLIRMIHTESLVNPTEATTPQSRITVNAAFGRTQDESTFVGEAAFSLISPPDSDPSPAVMIRCKLQLIYELIAGPMPTEEEVKAQEPAITAMISFQSWPYIREYVHNMTLRMALPPLILQPLVIQPVAEAPGTFRVAEPSVPAEAGRR